MQKFFLTIILSIILSSSLSAQEIVDAVWIARDTTSLQFGKNATWSVGESNKFRMTYFKNQFLGDSLVSEKKISDNISQFKVISKTQDSHLMEYQILEILKHKEDKNATSDLEESGESLISEIDDSDFVISYKTDNSGAFMSFTEPEKAIGACKRIMETVRTSSMSNSTNLTKKQKAKLQALQNLVGTGEVLFEKIFQVFISHFHNMYGFQLGIDDTLSYTEKSAPVLKDISNNLYSLIFINSVDTTNNDYEIVLTQEFDEEILTNLTRTILKKNLDVKNSKDLTMTGFIKAHYFFNPGNTWPRYIKIIKEITGVEKGKPLETTNQEVWIINSDLSED